MNSTPARAGAPGWAALASIGAGAIHATAAGAHGEHRQTAAAFALLALAQIGWGVLALLRAHPAISALGAAINVGAVAGWVLAKTTGIGAIDGLESAEGLGFADTAAAVLAGIAVAGAVAALAAPGWRPRFRGTEAVTAVAVSAIVLIAMVATGSHSHAGDHGHGADTVSDHDHTGTDDHADMDDDHADGHEDGDETHPPGTHPPATDPPATQPPATQPPATQPPATDPPATHPPGTHPHGTDHAH